MDRFSNDLRSEQNAKSLAFEILGHARDQVTATHRFLLQPGFWPALCTLATCATSECYVGIALPGACMQAV